MDCSAIQRPIRSTSDFEKQTFSVEDFIWSVLETWHAVGRFVISGENLKGFLEGHCKRGVFWPWALSQSITHRIYSLYECTHMFYCRGIDNNGVLLYEYSESAILHTPHFRRVVNGLGSEYNYSTEFIGVDPGGGRWEGSLGSAPLAFEGPQT